MEKKSSKSMAFYMRSIHRVLGYLCLGLVFIYSLSGIVLIHRTGDFMKKTISVQSTLRPDLSPDELAKDINMKRFNLIEENESQIIFNDGIYDKSTGEVRYSKREFVEPFNKFINLHKLSDSQDKHVAVITTIFGIILFLLAFTALFMFKPSNKQFARNMLYTAIGIIIALVLVLVI